MRNKSKRLNNNLQYIFLLCQYFQLVVFFKFVFFQNQKVKYILATSPKINLEILSMFS